MPSLPRQLHIHAVTRLTGDLHVEYQGYLRHHQAGIQAYGADGHIGALRVRHQTVFWDTLKLETAPSTVA